ncbi:hypothetical protein [Hyphococcus sp.]|uniref:hypothetical protein n=1 Tax=Hyphococcus sp. TaxID=2038636 RepID=UPI003CCB8D58
MDRVSPLPDGVAPSNAKSAQRDAVKFTVSDTAVPGFSAGGAKITPRNLQVTKQAPASSSRFYRFEEDDDEDDEDKNADKKRAPDPFHLSHAPHAPGPMAILVAIGLVLAALTAFVAMRNQPEPLPYCSEQPDWNQYNCRIG